MHRPTTAQLATATSRAARLLGTHRAWVAQDRVYLRLGGGWHLAISADDAGRFRLETCFQGRVAATLWCFCEDRDRLAALVLGAKTEVLALA